MQSDGKGVLQDDGSLLYANGITSGAWNLEIKYPNRKEIYNVPVAVIGDKLFSEKENYVTKEDRLRTLILKLLRENDWCDIGDLEDKMFVSHTTLEKDIKGIKKILSREHLH